MDNKNGYDLLISILGNIKDNVPRQCIPVHDKSTLFISIFLCVGLVISYLPQVKKKKETLTYLQPLVNKSNSIIELLPIKQVKASALGFYCLVLFHQLQVF